MSSINREWVGLTIAAAIMAAWIGWSCNAAQQKTILDVVHASTEVCKFVAELKCYPELLAACNAGHDVSDLLREAVQRDSTCPIGDAGAE